MRNYIVIFSFLIGCYCFGQKKHFPDTTGVKLNTFQVNKINDTLFTKGPSSLSKNKFGLYEMYLTGAPYQIGYDMGALNPALYHYQQSSFLDNVNTLVPSKTKQYLLRQFLKFYNRDISEHIANEYKLEFLGVSKNNDPQYNSIASPYMLNMYLHGAHDIGHAMQDLALVGCSSFALWGDKTKDSSLLIGRNFDFYAGDDFAQNKVVYFVAPEKGYKFMSVSWVGMSGVMSGMNEHGITVTINAAKSNIPTKAKTPISILTREILQYAASIDEAIEIAKNKEVFVSESILVGSGKENKAVIIEVSPKKFGVYYPSESTVISTNHFQSEVYQDDKNNLEQIKNSHSNYRFLKLHELLDDQSELTPLDCVQILRNKDGLKNEKIGLGNEKALNQLIAHHGIVFQPKNLKVWVSSNPFQLGAFVCYDLNNVFDTICVVQKTSFSNPDYLIHLDSFQFSKEYANYFTFKSERDHLISCIEEKQTVAQTRLDKFGTLNPYFWETYFYLGLYYYKNKRFRLARENFQLCLNMEITTEEDKLEVEKYLERAKRKEK